MAQIKVMVHTKSGKTISTKSSTPYKSIKTAKTAIPELRQMINDQIEFLSTKGEPEVSILDQTLSVKDIETITYKAVYF